MPAFDLLNMSQEELERLTVVEAAARHLVCDAITSGGRTFLSLHEFIERLDGKVKDVKEISGPEGVPITTVIVECACDRRRLLPEGSGERLS
jgi:hypothetical protein